MKKHLIQAVASALLTVLHCNAPAEPDSRRLQLDAAEQLALDAQKLEAASQRRRSPDDKTMAAVNHANAVQSMARAVDIWTRSGQANLVGAGLTELSRLYINGGDVDAAVATDRRLIDHWHAQGNVQREGEAHFELGTRLLAGRRHAEALANAERTMAFAQQNRLDLLYANTLAQKAMLLHVLGRESEAAAASLESTTAMAEFFRTAPPAAVQTEQARLPDRWVDIPTAPLIAELRMADGILRLVLTNRSAKSIGSATLGCVTRTASGWKLRQVLFAMSMNHGGIVPEWHFDVTRTFAGTRNWWTDRPMGCEEGRPGVVEVTFVDGAKWQPLP